MIGLEFLPVKRLFVVDFTGSVGLPVEADS